VSRSDVQYLPVPEMYPDDLRPWQRVLITELGLVQIGHPLRVATRERILVDGVVIRTEWDSALADGSPLPVIRFAVRPDDGPEILVPGLPREFVQQYGGGAWVDILPAGLPPKPVAGEHSREA
jgi:hypothetical protein